MTDRGLDDFVRRVMLDAARQEYGDWMEELPEHNFPPKFERKMQRLIHRADHPIRYRVIRAAACILLAALLSGCTILALAPEARAAFVGWIRELRQEWSSYHYDGTEVDTPRNTIFYPTWLPDGYQEIKAPELGTFVHALYENESGSRLSFTYQAGLKRITFHVAWENAQVQQTTVMGTRADFYQNTTGGSNILVWTDEAEGIVFWIAAPLAEKELVRIAESIRESEPLDWVYRPTWGYPLGSDIVSSTEQHGEGYTLFDTADGIPLEFFYSKSGATPYADRTDGQSIAIGARTGVLYPSGPSGTGRVLVWDDPDTGYAFWLVSGAPLEDMLRFAESVEIYANNMSGTFEIETADGMENAPLCQDAEQALTDEFAAAVRACARRDAEAGIYMQGSYNKMVKDYMAKQFSPERDSAAARVSALMAELSPVDKQTGEHILCLVEPLYFANIYVSVYNTTAHIYNENGVMIAAYNSGSGWFPITTYAEMQFSYTVTQIYAETYRAARSEMAQK